MKILLLQNKLITVTPDTKVLKAMQLMTGTIFPLLHLNNVEKKY